MDFSTYATSRALCLVIVGSLATACETDPGEDDTGAEASTGTTADPTTSSPADDSGTTEATTGDETDSGSDSGSGSESGEPPMECPPRDDSVVAAFSIELDGEPVVVDYSGFHGSYSGVPGDWQLRDELPEIDDMCEVVASMPGSLTVTCMDAVAMERTLTVQLSASEPLSTDVGEGPVHVWYMVNYDADMLEHVPATMAHSVVVSDDQGIVLAGVEGRYSIEGYSATLAAAWPQWPDASISYDPCPGTRGEAHFALEDGSSVDLFDGSAGDLGSYRALVETAVVKDEFDGEFDHGVPTVRWLIGLPPA